MPAWPTPPCWRKNRCCLWLSPLGMKFKIDQNLPAEFATILQQAGHDALTVFQQQLGGAPDLRIVAVCQQEDRILITADLDLRTSASTRQTGIPASLSSA